MYWQTLETRPRDPDYIGFLITFVADENQEIYENLYSQLNLREDFDKVQQNIQERVHHGLR